jgi:hypothetical protein
MIIKKGSSNLDDPFCLFQICLKIESQVNQYQVVQDIQERK